MSRALLPFLGVVLFSAHGAYGQSASELARMRFDADPQHSAVAFTVRLFGVAKVHGRFRDYGATIIYDPDHIERSSVTAVIAASSISTDMEFRDKHLRTPDFFDAERYPVITFQSDRVERTATGCQAIGRFTMHGVTRVITLPISIVLQPRSTGQSGTMNVAFSAATRLNRQDFGIAGTNKFNPSFDPASSMVSDSVDIALDIMANRPGYLTWGFTGQTPPSIADTVGRTIASRGVDDALRLYQQLHVEKPSAYNFSPGQLDALGHQLLQRGAVKDAVAVLRFNAQQFPSINGVAQSLADAYLWAGDSSQAVATYRQALAVDSLNPTAIELLRRLAAKGGT